MTEFQKRELSHAHILTVFAKHDKIDTTELADKVIRAEISDKEKESNLHALIVNHMLHKCDTACQNKDEKCRHHFPCDYAETTTQNT